MKTTKWLGSAIQGWEVTYFEPTYGKVSFTVNRHDKLAEDRAWLDAAGHVYTIREIER